MKRNMKFLQLSLALCTLGVLVQRCVMELPTYNCRYGDPSRSQPGPKLSVRCNDTTALLMWDLTELNIEQELEHLYVERNCSAIHPTNVAEQNTTDLMELTGPVYELYNGVKMLVSSTTVPIEEQYSCRYFGCVRPSLQQTWYTFNTASCIPPILMSSTLPSTSLIDPMRTVEPVSRAYYVSLTPDGTSTLLIPTIFMSIFVSTTSGTPPSTYPARQFVLPLVVVVTSLCVVILLALLLVCIIAKRSYRSRTHLHKYSITTPGQDVVDLNFFPVSPTLMETTSTSSEYSEFDKLYASEVEKDTADEDINILKTDSLNGSDSPPHVHSAHQSDTSEGTDCYVNILLHPDRVTKDSTDLHISTDKCCDSSSKLSNSISTQIVEASPKKLMTKQTSDGATTKHQTKDAPTNMKECSSSPRTGYITYQQEHQNEDTVDKVLSPAKNVNIFGFESGSVSGKPLVKL